MAEKEDELVIIEYQRTDKNGGFETELKFPKQSVDRIRMSEDTTKSQRIEKYSIYAGSKKCLKGL